MSTTAAAPRPITDEQKLTAMQLLELAMSTPREIADVFVDFKGHVEAIFVSIYDRGWKEGRAPDFSETAYLTGNLSGDEVYRVETVLGAVQAHLDALNK